MSNKNLFWKKWGGATMLLLVFLLNAASTIAQPLRAVNCDQLKVVIVPKTFDGGNDQASCADCCYPEYSCERMEYLVYLEAVPGVNLPGNGNFNLNYEELYIVLKLDRVNAVVSSINEAYTEACLGADLIYPDTIPDASFETKAAEDEVTLHISSALGDATPPIPFSSFVSSNYLFSISVDAFPGEEFGVGCADFTYISGNDTCTNQTCIGGDPEVFPLPNATNTLLTISLDDINCDPEEYIDLPILVSSSLSGGISSLDFAVVVTTDAPDGFYAAPEVVDTLAGTSPTISVMPVPGSPGQYVVRFRYVAQSATPFAGFNNQIAMLRIYRPPNLCQAYTIDASLLAGRIRSVLPGPIAGIVCRAVQLGGNTSEECEVMGMPICSEDFNFNLSTEADLVDCSTLKVYATLSWDTLIYGNTLLFKQVRSILNFDMDNGITITDVDLEGLSCPGSGNDPVLCQAGCEHFSGNTVELCINVGSPITVANNARIVITFDAPTGCVRSAAVRKMTLQRPDSTVCQPNLDTVSVFPYCSPMMENFIRGIVATEQGCWIEEVIVKMVAMDTTCNTTVLTGGLNAQNNPICEPYNSGCICDINTAESYEVKPAKNDNPLNGVTTYDLVLISKHILGIEPFNSPYKMIAADANKSGSITTFDITEIRKLILGIYGTLPNNTSWRFVLDTFMFPNMNNPFQTAFPEAVTIISLPDTLVDFIGIKVGDVNNTAITECDSCNALRASIGSYALREPRRGVLKTGDYYTLPVRAGGNAPLIAFQSAFRFDPTVLELISPSLGDAPGLSVDNFNLAQANEGIIRTSWFAPTDGLEEELLMPGQTLFNLTFRVRQDLSENGLLLSIDESLMPNLGWAQEGTAYSLQTETSSTRDEKIQPELPVWVRCRPNPSPGEVVFDILALPQPQRAQIAVFDAFGRRMWWRDLGKETGPMQINVSEAAFWPKGVYHWELRFDKQMSTGTFIRQ